VKGFTHCDRYTQKRVRKISIWEEPSGIQANFEWPKIEKESEILNIGHISLTEINMLSRRIGEFEDRIQFFNAPSYIDHDRTIVFFRKQVGQHMFDR
jgi:hypothetical protein